jgi:hypothetical protein
MSILVSSLLAQTEQEAVSKPFILKPVENVAPPDIRIQEPPLGSLKQWVTTHSTLAIKGMARHSSGIRSVNINGTEARLEDNGYFTVEVPLEVGKSLVVVSAISNKGSEGTFKFNVVNDNNPPFVEVLEPRLSEVRGIGNVESPTPTLRLRAYDESGIRSITVNGQQAKAAADSTYWIGLTLAEGDNDVVIVVTDNAGLTTERPLVLPHWGGGSDVGFLKGKSYALIIGIDKYKGKWNPLQNAVHDARAVEDLLRNRFIFDKIVTLFDQEATRENIIKTIESFQTTLDEQDRLLIYYSGHGTLQTQYNRGYWVPADATERSTAQYISNGDIQAYMGGLPAKHVLLVADACFAGDILRGTNEDDGSQQKVPGYFEKIAQKASRKALTSGGIETVVDAGKDGHSVFAFYFLQALSQMKGRYFDASQVFNDLKVPVGNETNQMPKFGAVKNTPDADGQYIFVRR